MLQTAFGGIFSADLQGPQGTMRGVSFTQQGILKQPSSGRNVAMVVHTNTRCRDPLRLVCRIFPLAREILPSAWLLAFVLLGCGSERTTDVAACNQSAAWSFAVIGDTRSNPDVFKTHILNVNALDPQPLALFHMGDLVSNGDLDFDWQVFHQCMSFMAPNIEFQVTPGNHDVGGARGREIFAEELGIEGPLYSAQEASSILFVELSTEEPDFVNEIGGEQLSWLVDTLSHSSATRIAVFMHRPLFPQGHYQGMDLANAEDMHNLFVRYGVDIVFASHEHQFFLDERDGVTYVISGGGGAPLYHENGGDFYHFLLACPGPETLCLQVITLSAEIKATYEIPFD
jgi:hypothetical protein